jgi:hypothetical protein
MPADPLLASAFTLGDEAAAAAVAVLDAAAAAAAPAFLPWGQGVSGSFDIGEEKAGGYFFGCAVSGFGSVSCDGCVSCFGSALFLVNVRSGGEEDGGWGNELWHLPLPGSVSWILEERV